VVERHDQGLPALGGGIVEQVSSRTVSVVIPCFNVAPFLHATIASVLAQTHPVTEVIAVDDGSTDDTAAVAGAFRPPVRVIRQANAGVSVARNHGLRAATGAFVALLDGDDIWEPEKVARQVAYLDAHPEAGSVGCNLAVFEDDCLVSETAEEDGGTAARPALAFLGAPRMPQVCSTVLMRRAVSDAVAFPEDIRDGEDVIFAACVRHVAPIGLVPDVLVRYRRHQRQYTQLPHVLSKGVQARLRWSRQHYPQVGASSYDEARRAVLDGAVELVMHRYWQRNLPAFHALRRELLAVWPADVPKPRELTRWYPPVAFLTLKDRLDAWRTSGAAPAPRQGSTV
jgi:glycosyltransferase involved in cell wall biosynthesis